ncbi:homeobox protein prospero isoform X2 [Anabrus simplex]|uniref:homeobox protein prospero isoform X2 n=1 Tax=Anabrus simplex TaxID=316456 RepID=UPI0035A29947
MSSTLSVPQWFGAGDLSRHAREFGFTFVGDDDDLVKQEYHPSLPPIPPLIPLGEAGRMKQVSVVDNNNIDSDDSGVRFSADEPGSYGGVIMVNSSEHGGGVEEEEDAEKLLRLFGGGDVSDSSVCSSATDGHHHHHTNNNNNNNKVPCADGGSGCTVVLNTLPTDLLRSLSTDGRISVERLGRTSLNGDQPSDSAREVRSLLQELVSAVERGENNQAEATGARQRRRPLLTQHHTRIDCDDESRDSYSSHLAGVAATTVATTAVAIETPTTTTRGGSSNNNNNKVRHRKSDSPRKAIRRRRERRSSSSGGKKRRKRSTSCSTTSSNCSNASSLRHHHRHHRKHRHRRRSPEVAIEEPPPTPRVNPIFVWIKQDDTRIVEVLCEDYDKRNRIRLTKTAHGWRAIPRTERLASASSSATVVSDEQQPPAVAAAAVVPTAAEKQPRASESVPAPAASSGTDSGRIEAPPAEEQQVDCSLTDGETADQNNDELVSTIHDNHMSTVMEEDECDNQDETKEEEDEGVCEDEEALPEGDEQLMEMAEEEEHFPDELMEGEEEDDMTTEEQIVNNCEYADGEGEAEFEEPVMDEDCVEEDLTPTDLSIPKIRDDNQSTPIPKIIPRCMSTVIPPVVQSPQPRLSPSQSFPPAPAHQPKTLHKSMFLESLLSSPRKCHEASRRLSLDVDKGPEPLDLGVSSARGAGSPTVSCSDESRKTARPLKDSPEGEPKPKRLKVEDITLKNLLSRQPNVSLISPEIELTLASKKEEMTESGRKSRLLELLTSEPAPASISPSPTLDPLTQLKKVLSDPDITVPDPLLVPRNRLQELVANPAKEIPRLLALRPELRLPEALAYPTLLRDPDLLVVSLSHLQHLLQKPDKNSKEDDTSTYSTLGTFLEWQRYQNQQQAAAVAKEILDSQLKQQQHHQHQHQQQQQQQQQQQELDAATAAALNQMLWMPYLSQLEAAAVQCGNNQEFLAMLNAVFPSNYPSNSGQYPFVAGANPAAFNIASTDYKSQMELQQALALWHEAMIQASASAANNNNNSSSNNNNIRLSKAAPVTNNVGKNFTSSGRYPQAARKFNSSSARTSPVIHNNFHSSHPLPQQQQQQQQRNVGNNHLYMPSNGYGTASQLHQQYNLQRCRTNGGSNANLAAAVKHLKHEDKSATPRSSVNGSSLMNVLSIPRRQDVVSSQHQSKQQQQQHSHLLAALGKSSNLHQQNNDGIPQLVPLPQPLDLSGATPAPSRKPAPKLKVKQHLIDPSITPKLLLKDDPPPEVGSTTNHPHLWHPLFGRRPVSTAPGGGRR